MKIAERIIFKKKIIDYKIICLFLADNEKYVYYYEEIKKHSKDSLVYYPKEKAKGLSMLKDVYYFKKMLQKSGILIGVKSVYAASIDNRYVQLVASILKNEFFYTFDDGLANLNYKGSYYKDEFLSKTRLFLWKVIGVDFFAQNFRKKSKVHYSLYENKKNIIDNVEHLSLFSGLYQGRSDTEGEINIFLGQPLYEVNNEADSEYINKVLKKLSINYYFPHPRESYKIDQSFNVVVSNLIFEDYILNILEDGGQSEKINIYTYFSTAILNLNDLKFINTYIVVDSIFDKELYLLFEDFDVKTIYLGGV